MKKTERRILVLAGGFLLLGLLLFNVPGIRFSSYVSMGIGGLFLCWFVLGRLPGKPGQILRRFFCVGLVAVLLVLGCLEAAIIARGKADQADLPVDAMIVLGAGVNGTTPSLTLRTRIDAALPYILNHPGVPVVLSGGQGAGEDITEAACMRRELISHPERPTDTPMILLLEERSTSTAENFRFSKELLEEYGIDTETAVIGVVTNDFHIFRAGVIAGREGLQMVGVGAELPWWWLETNYYLREAFALVKTYLFDV